MEQAALIQHYEHCYACEQLRNLENARLAWRDLYNLKGHPNSYTFDQLVSLGSYYYNSQMKCFRCQHKAERKRSEPSQ